MSHNKNHDSQQLPVDDWGSFLLTAAPNSVQR